MAIIGTFTQTGNGLAGTVKTLTLNAKVRFVPVEKDNDKSPDFRVIAGTSNVELGAAWKKTSKEGRPYTSVKLDDPSFPAPIYASLIEAEDGASSLMVPLNRTGAQAPPLPATACGPRRVVSRQHGATHSAPITDI